MSSKLEICSSALLLLGHNQINSLDQPGAGPKLIKALYENTYKDFLSSNNWDFNKKTAILQLIEKNDVQEQTNFKYAFRLSNDFLRIQGIEGNADYKIYGKELHTDNNSVTITYFAMVPEDYIPSYAALALEYLLASRLCIPLTNDASKAKLFSDLAMNQLRGAKFVDSQNAPNDGFQSKPILDVRMR